MTHISEIVDRIMPYLDKESIWHEVAKRLVDGDQFDDPYERLMSEARTSAKQALIPVSDRVIKDLDAFASSMEDTTPIDSSSPQGSPHEQFDRFISECCELGEDHAASSRELWDAYLAWAEPSSDPDCGLSWTMFSRMVAQLDGVAKFKDRKSGGRMAFRGIGLKEQAE